MVGKSTIVAAMIAALPLVAASQAGAQSYPNRPVRVLVGFAPAGPADMIARIVCDKLSEFWGQPVLIENATAPPPMWPGTAPPRPRPTATRF
jgi:tripartite-type tricarboxylate transporter receptor subunit TctC